MRIWSALHDEDAAGHAEHPAGALAPTDLANSQHAKAASMSGLPRLRWGPPRSCQPETDSSGSTYPCLAAAVTMADLGDYLVGTTPGILVVNERRNHQLIRFHLADQLSTARLTVSRDPTTVKGIRRSNSEPVSEVIDALKP
jgi:hypothetical protein